VPSLDSFGSQKPEHICVLNSIYHLRTDALICFSAKNYRNQFADFFLLLLSFGGTLKHFTSEHWISEKRTSISTPALFLVTTALDEKLTLKSQQQSEDELAGSSAEHQTVLQPQTHPTSLLPQLSDAHIQIPPPSTPTA